MYKKEITISNWMKLYDSCTSIHSLKKLNSKDYLAFKSKTGNEVRIGQSNKLISKIPRVLSYYKFFAECNMFWMIPLELPSQEIVGFILKSFSSKEYRTVIFSKIPVFFGLYGFKDFVRNNLVILTEGSKDCMYVKTLYPYSLSLNTSKLTSSMLQIIKYLTNKVLLLYDNDATGILQTKYNTQQLSDLNIRVFKINYQLKDPGEYFTASFIQQQLFNNEINKVISLCNR